MSGFPRSEIDEMVERWLRANRDCEASGDWRPLAEMYTEDATYGWNLGPNTDFMAVGRGLGGSWFRYGGDFQWAWQRDWFDLGNVSALFLEMVAADKLSDSMKARVQMSDRGSMPGCYRAGTAPVQLWDR